MQEVMFGQPWHSNGPFDNWIIDNLVIRSAGKCDLLVLLLLLFHVCMGVFLETERECSAGGLAGTITRGVCGRGGCR